MNSQSYIQNAPLSKKPAVKDLGIVYDFKSMFNQHINPICKKFDGY